MVNAVLLERLVRAHLPSMGQAINRQHRSNVIAREALMCLCHVPQGAGLSSNEQPCDVVGFPGVF